MGSKKTTKTSRLKANIPHVIVDLSAAPPELKVTEPTCNGKIADWTTIEKGTRSLHCMEKAQSRPLLSTHIELFSFTLL
jgi:hypothetical protein